MKELLYCQLCSDLQALILSNISCYLIQAPGPNCVNIFLITNFVVSGRFTASSSCNSSLCKAVLCPLINCQLGLSYSFTTGQVKTLFKVFLLASSRIYQCCVYGSKTIQFHLINLAYHLSSLQHLHLLIKCALSFLLCLTAALRFFDYWCLRTFNSQYFVGKCKQTFFFCLYRLAVAIPCLCSQTFLL